MSGRKRTAKKQVEASEPVSKPLRLEWRSPAELAENPRNWRRHPEAQVAALSDVLAEVGWAGACLYNEATGRLIDGHARRKVALDQGAESVPVLVGSWSEADEAKILATLDPIAGMAQADAAALDALLRDVQTGSQALGDMLTSLAEDAGVVPPDVAPGGGGDEFDPTPEQTGPTRTKPGELWVIGGKHRLLVGDCTVPENVARLMGGRKIDIVPTSPPYTDQREYGIGEFDWHGLMCGAFDRAIDYAAPGCHLLIILGPSHKDRKVDFYWNAWLAHAAKAGWPLFGFYIWDKGSGAPGGWNGRLAPCHEFVFHFNRNCGPANKWVATTGRQDKGGARFRQRNGSVVAPSSPDKIGQEFKVPDSVIRVDRENTRGDYTQTHPAVFPLDMPAFLMRTWSEEEAAVYDPFLGSGTTLIAAHRLGRVCYGCEIEPRYADVILKRAEAEGLICERADG